MAAERLLSELNSQGVANTAGAFATVKQPHEKLFAGLARWGYQRVGDFSPQDVQMALWAFSQRVHAVVS